MCDLSSDPHCGSEIWNDSIASPETCSARSETVKRWRGHTAEAA